MCIACQEKPARNERSFLHMCKGCLVGLDEARHYDKVAAESARYLEKIAAQQEWSAREPSFRFLILPDVSAPPLPQYASTPEARSLHHCRLCLQPVEVGALEPHLQKSHQLTMQEYRQRVLGRTLVEWPQPVAPETLRSRLAAFREELCDFNFQLLSCAVCARQKRRCKLFPATFPPVAADVPPTWLPWSEDEWQLNREMWYHQVDEVLNVENYLRVFFMADQRLMCAEQEVGAFRPNASCRDRAFPNRHAAECWRRRVERWVENLRADLMQDSVPAPGNPDVRWLLFQSTSLTTSLENGTITCLLCKTCRAALTRVKTSLKTPDVQMPRDARANGLWRGPDPAALAELSYCEAKVVNLARIYVSVKRVFLSRGSYAPTSVTEAPLYHQKNVVAYPQEVDSALCTVGLDPVAPSRTLLVQFVGGDRRDLRYCPDLRVSVLRLRAAFRWLSENSWPFMEATKQHILWETNLLDPSVESLLTAYEKSIGCTTGGVPAELVQSASGIAMGHASVHLAGPADCAGQDDGLVSDAESLPGALPNDSGNDCAAALNGGVDEISLLKLWDQIMKKYKVAQCCEEELARPRADPEESKKEALRVQRMLAISEAVEALSSLTHRETRAKLAAFAARDRGVDGEAMRVPRAQEFLSNSDPLFWYSCFVRLFPRGDCLEKWAVRSSALPSWRWAKCLLTRADCSLWRKDVEFVASVYNIFLRRDQVSAVEATMRTLDSGEMQQIQALTAEGLWRHALSCGDINDVRTLLKRKKLELPIQTAFQKIQVSQRRVRGSEAEKDNIVPKFFALRLWSGCSSLFFTLNPHDIRSPITLVLLQADAKFERAFSLDLDDASAEEYMREFLVEHPRRLHQLVAGNPLVATRCFHWTVRLVIRTLFNCDDKPGQCPDSVASKDVPGVFGHVRAYYGVVEPQMRKALHIHMLVQILGFSHPEDILGEAVLPEVFRRLWYYVASVSFRSSEAFADYLGEEAATAALARAPLLPLTKKQRDMIGQQK